MSWSGATPSPSTGFAEAVADGQAFEVDGRAIPVIGLAALIKNKRAVGREQDIADVKALESQ